MAPTIVFTDDLNVSDAGQGSYTNMIQNIRTKLGQLSNRKSHGLPVLPNQKKPPTDWVDITLRARDPNNAALLRAIKLRIRVENLYLDGYQRPNASTGAFVDGQNWFEFKGDDQETEKDPKKWVHLIPNSTFLPFNGSYGQLNSYSAVKLENSIELGKQKAVNAINNLNNTAISNATLAESLMNMIVLLSESSRFTDISDFLGATFHNNTIVKLDHRKVVIINNWQVLSGELLKMDANPLHKFNFPEGNNITPKITSQLDAVAVLGILLGDNARATVVVTLVNPTITNVYGLIDARYCDNVGCEFRSVLFHKESSKELNIDVTPHGQVVVLSESVVDVPLYSSLIVKADLKGQDDHVIAQDHAEFPAQLSEGTFVKQISGEHGEIHVKVTWI